ncbi:Serine/threonine-protein kinase PknJ [Mycolicibacterium vanbaalenii]|uniref:non-specific serine/threonine protein kinase n=1 Tax=Mycolicibacterium vanbaalenii TaxID=110539 RepID=A0A5S9QWT7_MYCVN|nr:serine/threonine-protein kinase [Mycolicibacterium vanbaalenii]CAA0123251.1 Serine/threonine-protein kinase PknJ [Mycolicibacterium vanbaalenii]
MSSERAPDTPGSAAAGQATPPVGDAVSMFAVGSLVSGYRIEQVLATGATGTVYLAKNPTLPRRDALKVLSADLSRDPAFRKRFVREADIASLLDHPNIVSIYNRGESDEGHLWIAMQYVAGTDAEAAMQDGTMTAARAIRIVSEVAKALDYAHQRNVVHHDVKPGNVLLAAGLPDDEHVMLSDFGVARAAGSLSDSGDGDSTVAVTLAYAAPEVIAGEAVDGRADIYSLGCTLFRMLTGKQPFYTAEGTTELARAHLNQPPPRISDHLSAATRQLDVVMARALAKNPEERFASAREFTAAAAAAATSLTESPPPSTARKATQATTNPLRLNTSERIRSISDSISFTPASLRRRRIERPVLILWAVFAVLAVIAGVLWTKVISSSSSEPENNSAPTSTTMATSSAAPAPSALVRLLPAGYPRGTCAALPTASDVTAAVSCGPNTDPGGPTASTYTLSRDQTSLNEAFTDTVNRASAAICPPNIQCPVLCPTGVSKQFGEWGRR